MSAMWPDIPYEPWRETCSALHLYTQIVGKYRLAQTPWINHSWHATLYVDARGFTTSLVQEAGAVIEQLRPFLMGQVTWRSPSISSTMQ